MARGSAGKGAFVFARAVVVAAVALAAAESVGVARAAGAGDAAPPLDVAEWVVGADRVADLPGCMRVVAFVSAASASLDGDLALLTRLHNEFEFKGIRVVGVMAGSREDVQAAVEVRQPTFPVAADHDGATRTAFGVPATSDQAYATIVASDGRIAWSGALGDGVRTTLAACFVRPGGYNVRLAPRTPWDQATKRHAELASSNSFGYRVRGREALARSGDVRALTALAAVYARPEEPKDFVRFSLVTTAASFLCDPVHDAVWSTWLTANCDAEDAWLWHRAAWAAAPFDRGWRAQAGMERKDPFVAAASLQALANAPNEVALAVVAKTLAGLPARGLPRRLLVEAAAHVVARHAAAADAAMLETCAGALVELIDDTQTGARTKAVLVAELRRTLGSTEDTIDLGVWRTELAMWKLRRKAADQPAPAAAPPAYGKDTSYFFGLPVRGERIVFVIDASTSMLEAVDEQTLIKRRAPVTGRRQEEGLATSIDWSRVHTRFDLAREALRVTLEKLPERTRFAVVLFGEAAATMAATPSILPASPGNRKAVLGELDVIAKAAVTSKQLRGDTNLHGALRVAYALGVSRKADAAYTSLALLDEGCDSIYVLSDGQPNRDDWFGTDRRDSEDAGRIGNDGQRAADADVVRNPGPYWTMRGSRGFYSPFELLSTTPSYVVEDVARMNLFRHASINCVALSTADMELLQSLARLGGGDVLKFD
ncbi:MAG: redoxin domain-containing protein [Planctomycetes bacterium]|nr:redoxin domain-containing protein [Planctomycetota bacterium]